MRWLPLLLITVILCAPALALDKLTGFVNDEAGVISPEYEQLLNDKLYNLKLNTSVEMAVATVKSLGGVPIDEYSLNLAHKTLGEQGKDNGVLVFLAVDDREYRIEVGYGLEPVLNAALLGRIGRNVMETSFKEGNYEKGLAEGVAIIDEILRGDTSFETQGSGAGISQSIQPLIFALVIFSIFFLPLIIRLISNLFSARKKAKEEGKENDHDFIAAMILASMFGKGGRGGSGGFGGGSSGGFGGFGGGSFGGGGFSGKF